jgi:hypothetical protein
MTDYPNPSEFEETFLRCPLTNKIFHTPIITNEGIVFEEQAYLKNNNNYDFYRIVTLKNFITNFLDNYPEFKKDQYCPDNIEITNHAYNKKIIDIIFQNNNYIELQKYNNFDLQLIDKDFIDIFLKKSDNEIIKYFIDNVIDLSVPINNSSWHLVNYVCNRLGKTNPDIVKHLLLKNNQMKLNCMDDDWSPLHQLLYFSKSDNLLKFAIDKHIDENIDIYFPNKNGTCIIEACFTSGSEVVINYMLTKIDKTSTEFKNLIPKLLKNLNNNSTIKKEVRELIIQKIVLFNLKN